MSTTDTDSLHDIIVATVQAAAPVAAPAWSFRHVHDLDAATAPRAFTLRSIGSRPLNAKALYWLDGRQPLSLTLELSVAYPALEDPGLLNALLRHDEALLIAALRNADGRDIGCIGLRFRESRIVRKRGGGPATLTLIFATTVLKTEATP